MLNTQSKLTYFWDITHNKLSLLKLHLLVEALKTNRTIISLRLVEYRNNDDAWNNDDAFIDVVIQKLAVTLAINNSLTELRSFT